MGTADESLSKSKELQSALERLDQRAAGDIALESVFKRFEGLPRLDLSDRSNRETRARLLVTLVHTMYAAGRLTRAEVFYFVTMPLIVLVHESRWSDGDYDKELNPISERIREIEKLHGLSDDEFWPIGQGPEEYRELNRQYEETLDHKQADVFREFGEPVIAHIWESNREEFYTLFEKGRVAIFEKEDKEQGLKELAEHYENEAYTCAEVGSYYAACALIGAAMETRLLLRCFVAPEVVSQTLIRLPDRIKPQSNNPVHWNLNTLLEVCNAAGWLPHLEGELVTHVPEGWGHLVRGLRNLLHPGRHILT